MIATDLCANRLDRPFAADELDDVNHSVNKMPRKRLRKRRKIIHVKGTKICTMQCRFNLVRNTARKCGMTDVNEWQDWQVYWTDMFPSLDRCRAMKRYQRINHFPGMLELCRKDTLAKNLHAMLKRFPKDYDFFPRTWCLPEDSLDMIDYAKKCPGKTFILKPCRGSEGRGISITKNPKQLRTKFNMIGQIYISRPLLIDGFKFDFRLYVLVTSCDPLRVYVYNEGLARFATKKYEPTRHNLNQKFMHLTNYSVNRRSEDFIIDDEEGSKRELNSINELFEKNGYEVHKIWNSIDDIIIKTLLVVLPKLKHYYRLCFSNHMDTFACFELLGFDFILDNHLKPFLLEINHSPSFNRNTPVDRRVKDPLLKDAFTLLDLSRNEKSRIDDAQENTEQPSLWNQRREMAKRKARCLQILKNRFNWQDSHMGNFRKIYPSQDAGKYRKFSKSNEKQCLPKTQVPLFTEEDYDLEKEKRRAEPQVIRTNPFLNKNDKDTPVIKMDEKSKRDLLMRSHNLIQNMCDKLNRSGEKRIQMEINLSRNNNWDVEGRHTEEYRLHKEQLTTGISAVLKTISSKSEIPLRTKEKLSSIFLNPSFLHNTKNVSHIGPIGHELLSEAKKMEEVALESENSLSECDFTLSASRQN